MRAHAGMSSQGWAVAGLAPVSAYDHDHNHTHRNKMSPLNPDAPVWQPAARPRSAPLDIPSAGEQLHDLHDDLPQDPFALSSTAEVREVGRGACRRLGAPGALPRPGSARGRALEGLGAPRSRPGSLQGRFSPPQP